MVRRSMMLAALALAFGAAACTAEVEDEGKAPEVEVKGGEMPKVDVDPAQMDVGTDTNTVVTPEVKVTPTEGTNP